MSVRNRITVTCQRCGKEFETTPSHPRKYCSHACYWGERLSIVCQECGKTFEVVPARMNAKYCSRKCKDKAWSREFQGERVPWYRGEGLATKTCCTCGKEFFVHQCRASLAKYCSQTCHNIARRGVHRTLADTKDCETCGKTFSLRDRGEGAKYCSMTCYGKARSQIYVGANTPSWKGGITTENNKARASMEYVEWRDTVYRRDGWTCQVCGEKPRGIVGHHIFSFADYPELRHEVWNGITMCRSCHAKAHVAYSPDMQRPSFK